MTRNPSSTGGDSSTNSNREDSFSVDASESNLAGADLVGASVSLDADYDVVPTAHGSVGFDGGNVHAEGAVDYDISISTTVSTSKDLGGGVLTSLIQDFSLTGENVITDFNPRQGKIYFRDFEGVGNIAVSEVRGGTLIDAGRGDTLQIKGVTPEALAGRVLIAGELIPGNGGFNLQNTLQIAADSSEAAIALASALDHVEQQCGGVSDTNKNGAETGQALLDEDRYRDEDQNDSDGLSF